nr:hypothetical protein [Tanacetum cinerariifolium]
MSEAKNSGSTVNTYLIEIRDDSTPGIVKPLFEENIKFEFWGQCIEELKANMFYGNDNEDTHEHISNITDIIDLFHSPRVARDQALEKMLKYAKFMKDLLAKKGKAKEKSKITLNERCSTVLLNKISFKEKDPGTFTIPCVIGKIGIDKALADLGASISLMSYSMFARLDLGELKPTRMYIKLANKSTQYWRGIAENVIVKIDKFIFSVDFVVLDMEEDHKIPILGRPFLATAHVMMDVFNKKITFEVGNETITFDIKKSMKFSTTKDDSCLSIDMVDIAILDNVQEILPSTPLDSFLFEPVENYQQRNIVNLWGDENDEIEHN